jgi:hypothetical protein
VFFFCPKSICQKSTVAPRYLAQVALFVCLACGVVVRGVLAETGSGQVSATIRVTATVEPSLGLSRAPEVGDAGKSNAERSDAWALWQPAGAPVMMSTYVADCCVITQVLGQAGSGAAVNCLECDPLPQNEDDGADAPADLASGNEKPATRTILIFDPGT